MLIALLILIVLSAYFSATETAFSSLNKIRMRSRADDGDHRAALALRLAEDYDRLLSTVLIGNNIVNITATTLATVLCTRLWPVYGPTAATVLLTVVILIFGEITPKSLAKERAEAFASKTAGLLCFFLTLLSPLNFLFGCWRALLARLVRAPQDEGITEEELITMVSEAESEGGLEPHESELIRAAIEFNDLEISEILVPRVDIVAAEDTDSMEQIAALFAQSGYSRIPIYHESLDNIVGILHEKDFHAARYHNQKSIAGIMGEVTYTTGSAKLSDVLHVVQKAKTHMVIVVDEYGGTDGLVTLEDILEELVGEIWDEHDEVIEEFRKQEDGSYLIACSANLSELFDRFSMRGEGESATVSGWVMEQVGGIPAQGDHFDCDNLSVTVTRVDHNRVLEIRVVVTPREEAKN